MTVFFLNPPCVQSSCLLVVGVVKFLVSPSVTVDRDGDVFYIFRHKMLFSPRHRLTSSNVMTLCFWPMYWFTLFTSHFLEQFLSLQGWVLIMQETSGVTHV